MLFLNDKIKMSSYLAGQSKKRSNKGEIIIRRGVKGGKVGVGDKQLKRHNILSIM
jgi:hypothetical protein